MTDERALAMAIQRLPRPVQDALTELIELMVRNSDAEDAAWRAVKAARDRTVARQLDDAQE